ncbi:MAG TPA: hypothetical protein PKY89_07740 [Deltaproteobacteria bacterium]|nr:hypothetical protein [Deltaproteobacteria bacterium]
MKVPVIENAGKHSYELVGFKVSREQLGAFENLHHGVADIEKSWRSQYRIEKIQVSKGFFIETEF